jgi:phage terminase Nu1 subunit (DNA packaging protein)
MTMRDDDDWLEGGAADETLVPNGDKGSGELVPVALATKAQLAAVTGLTITAIDRLVRDGAPVARRGASRKEGLRFDLPAFIGWYVERVASRRAAAGDSFVSAKERGAVALATIRELEIAEKQKTLIGVADVASWIEKRHGEFRSAVLGLPSQVQSLSEAQRSDLEEAVWHVLADLSGATDEYTAANLTPNASAESE